MTRSRRTAVREGVVDDDANAALIRVLEWVRRVDTESPLLAPIAGIDDVYRAPLARLGALLRSRISDDVPDSLVTALTPTAAIEVGADILGAFDRLIEHDAVVHLATLYAAIVAPSTRRTLGTFFTPRQYAQVIVSGFASRHAAPAEVIDVGAGVGIFSELAHGRWPLASVRAIDINPLTLGLQSVASNRGEVLVELVLDDYRRWLKTNIPKGPTLYLGNPPYTRWQLLGRDARLELLKATNGLVGARANLSTLFLAMTLAQLRPEDSIAMIIPAGWMQADYGKKLRAHLRSERERSVRLQLADSWRFDEAIVDAVLVEIGPKSKRVQPIKVSDWSGSERMVLSRADGEAPFAAPGRVPLAASNRLEAGLPLAKFARVTRGTASGANRFFVNPPEVWRELGIPQRFRRPLARRLRSGRDSSQPAVEVSEILVLEGFVSGRDINVDAWIRSGEADGIHEQHLCSLRSKWYDLSSELKTPDVIISALARETFHVMENPRRLAITNNLFGLYWHSDTDPQTRENLLGWLRSRAGQTALRSSSSVEANGLHRLSPKAIGTIETTGAYPHPLEADGRAHGLIQIAGRPQ